MTREQEYRKKISSVLQCNEDHLFFYWKGRVALYAALKALNIGEGDEVVLPSFTCVVVPNAILYLKAKPVYVDIDKKAMNCAASSVISAVTERTKCIVIQNTFGLSYQVEEIIAFAKERGIPTIEDCTHGFGGSYNGLPNGRRSDFSFYSTQWNKPFSTGVGGILLINDERYIPAVNDVNRSLEKPGFISRFMLWVLIRFNRYFITDRSYWVLVRLYRFLSKTGLVLGSSSGGELSSPEMPEHFFRGACGVQFAEGTKALDHLKRDLALRRKNASLYTEFLSAHARYFVDPGLAANHSFLKYPILVKDRNVFLAKAEKTSIRLGEWFESQIHPVHEGFEKWQLKQEDHPVSLRISEHILNLPTDSKHPDKVIRFLKENLEDLL